MQKHLATDFTANYLTTNMVDNDKGEDVLSGKLHEKVIDMEWVTAIEDTLPYIEKAIDEQRRFIIENNEIYRIDKAKIAGVKVLWDNIARDNPAIAMFLGAVFVEDHVTDDAIYLRKDL